MRKSLHFKQRLRLPGGGVLFTQIWLKAKKLSIIPPYVHILSIHCKIWKSMKVQEEKNEGNRNRKKNR